MSIWHSYVNGPPDFIFLGYYIYCDFIFIHLFQWYLEGNVCQPIGLCLYYMHIKYSCMTVKGKQSNKQKVNVRFPSNHDHSYNLVEIPIKLYTRGHLKGSNWEMTQSGVLDILGTFYEQSRYLK